ncbi:hypothetical protein Godav_003905 [Gossypium davidsonii]|uniref:CCHC-type domain-containing protein n=1 Tax=Gossypium davidsonii TaxID=34287 RepID=A0A7J8SJ79_GOSDV|nr:hypothetical protein [Gossypium davidsonii]
MYRVFKSLWFTKEEVDFVALREGAIIVKFGCLEDRSRILNLTPWLFDRCLFSMVPFENGKAIDTYEFWKAPFWLRVYNIPIELMDRQTALDIGNAIGELAAIDWKDRNGGVVELVDTDETETIGVFKYERLPDFCYECGKIGHTVKSCTINKESEVMSGLNPQFGSWLRAPIVSPNQDRSMRRNGVELVK